MWVMSYVTQIILLDLYSEAFSDDITFVLHNSHYVGPVVGQT